MSTSNTQEQPLNKTPLGETSELSENTSVPSGTNDSSSSSPNTVSPQCSQCKKPETDPEKPFKPCSKCQTEKYCSRDCQKAAWKVHKKVCGEKAQAYATSANLKMDAPRVIKKEGFRGGKSFLRFLVFFISYCQELGYSLRGRSEKLGVMLWF